MCDYSTDRLKWKIISQLETFLLKGSPTQHYNVQYEKQIYFDLLKIINLTVDSAYIDATKSHPLQFDNCTKPYHNLSFISIICGFSPGPHVEGSWPCGDLWDGSVGIGSKF